MKKLLTLAMAVVFASSMAFAQKGSDAKKGPMGPEGMRPGPMMGMKDDAKMKEMRQEMEKNRKEMTELSDKYNKETDAKKKAAIENDIKTKVASNYDKNITRMEERVKDSKERLAKAEQMLTDSKKPENRQKHIDEITQRVISGKTFGADKGQKKGWDKFGKNSEDGKKVKEGKDNKKAAKK